MRKLYEPKYVVKVPFLLLWDHAAWHRGLPVAALLDANPRLQVMLFPTAAPNLNLQG